MNLYIHTGKQLCLFHIGYFKKCNSNFALLYNDCSAHLLGKLKICTKTIPRSPKETRSKYFRVPKIS